MHTLYGPNGHVSGWIRSQFPEGYVGFGIDVGASDGVSINSTYVLEKRDRWTILSVEANPYFKPILLQQRAFVKMCAVASQPSDGADFHINLDNLEAYSALKVTNHPKMLKEAGERWAVTKVPVRTLEQLLAEFEFPRLDALCIDVEGGERDVLDGLDLGRWLPKTIVIECWEAGQHDEHLKQFGYKNVWRSADNDCFSREEA